MAIVSGTGLYSRSPQDRGAVVDTGCSRSVVPEGLNLLVVWPFVKLPGCEASPKYLPGGSTAVPFWLVD